MLDYNVLRFLN